VRRIRESLFFIPTATLLFFVVLAALSIWVDSGFTETFEQFPLVLSATVSGGRAIATTVAGATITVAAIVFSITALSTQMTASQYSPRSVGGFFDDPFQQMIIGLVVGTFTYSLLILAGLGDVMDGPNGATPSLSVSLTILLGVRIAGAALKSVREDLEEPSAAEVPEASPPKGPQSEVLAKRTGWVTSIDAGVLLSALPPSTTARIDVRVGEAVSEGDQIATLWNEEENDGEDDGDRVAMRVRDAVGLASQRSISSDPTFGIRQLVDIALRALSPGVNDPTTAVDVLHHLKIPIREVLLSDAPKRVFTGPENQRVYLSETPSRTDYVHMAFAEIRLAAGNQLSVIEALAEVLEDLESELEVAGLSGRAAAVQEEFRLTIDMARRSGLPEPDLQRVIGRELEEANDNGTPENPDPSIG